MNEAEQILSEMSTGNGLRYFKTNIKAGYPKDDFLNNFQEYLSSLPIKNGVKRISTNSFFNFLFDKKMGKKELSRERVLRWNGVTYALCEGGPIPMWIRS